MKRAIIAFIFMLLPLPAYAQSFPGFMPPYTVVCNNTASQAVPANCTSITLKGTVGFLAPTAASGVANGILDTTAVVATEAAFWTGYNAGGATLGNPVIHFMNRLMVGEESTKSGACHSGTHSWILVLFGATCESGQIAVTSTLGTFAITAAVRSSDFRTWHAAASQGSSAASLFGYNDDTGAGSPIVDTMNIEAIHGVGVNGITLGAQFNMDNICCNHIADPFTTMSTATLLLTPGGTPPGGVGEFNTDAALIVGNSSGFGVFFNAGIIIQDAAITTGAGPTVNGAGSTVGIAMQSAQAMVWYSAANTASGAIYSGAASKVTLWAANDIILQANNGTGAIDINPGGAGGIKINTVAGVSCGPGAPTAGFKTINGIVTVC